MSDPHWLSLSEIERLHAKVIEAGGGSHGLRDAGLLESALARPQNLHAYGEGDTFQLAASYAEGIARNHAFVDGNKRTAFAASAFFLRKNGIGLTPRQDDGYVVMMENLGQGKVSREEMAAYLRDNAMSLSVEKFPTSQLAPSLPAKDWTAKPAAPREIKPLNPSRNRDRDR